ncbi:MAG: pilus assembly PilX N-terminal domain-containing protein, partial [Nocardioides sp.]|uniref:pilus assembly PilX N-terminal domain-containing protein n=1 Tax=Nocardioides sp. TaxID=35761 RepID=UPI003F085C04
MLRRLDEFLHRSSRAHDERGAAMPIVVMVVLVGFLVSSAIATTTLGSVRQTTHGRSNVQAFAAAEAGRDSMVAGISQAVPSCPSSTGTITGASWSVELFYVPGTTLPSGTTYAADGTPQPAAAWTPVTCDGLAAAAAGDYTVVVAATGVATIDGTTRVLDAVHPFHVEPPDNSIVGTVQGPFVLGSAGTGSVGTPAWSGGPLVISGPPGQTNFTCGGTLAQPTVVDADVYLLNGDAEFPGAGCHITGDLYVQRDISVSGRPSLGGVLGGDNR